MIFPSHMPDDKPKTATPEAKKIKQKPEKKKFFLPNHDSVGRSFEGKTASEAVKNSEKHKPKKEKEEKKEEEKVGKKI